MNSDIQLETAAIFFLSNLYLKQDIGKVYVMVDFIWMGLPMLQGARSKNYKVKNSCPVRDSISRALNCGSTTVTDRSSYLKLKLNQVLLVLFIATSYDAAECLSFI